jgi:predicted glycoside hydrolase/deacetylase ChbG (UPF0249 family)
MKYLIVTADDMGLTKSINEGIVEACREGVVTAVSVIPTGEALQDALDAVKTLPFKDIGAHLSLTETKPLLSSSKFYKNHNRLFFDLLSGRVNMDNIYFELKAQAELLKKSGFKITHINSHEHVHIVPRILEIFIRIAKEYGIPAIRFPRTDRPANGIGLKDRYRKLVLAHFSSRISGAMKDSGLKYTDGFAGLLDAGRLDIDKVNAIISGLKEGVTELVTHPAYLSPEIFERYFWHKGGETELFALTDRKVKMALESHGVKLMGYGEMI